MVVHYERGLYNPIILALRIIYSMSFQHDEHFIVANCLESVIMLILIYIITRFSDLRDYIFGHIRYGMMQTHSTTFSKKLNM